jgi:hypothetical protein
VHPTEANQRRFGGWRIRRGPESSRSGPGWGNTATFWPVAHPPVSRNVAHWPPLTYSFQPFADVPAFPAGVGRLGAWGYRPFVEDGLAPLTTGMDPSEVDLYSFYENELNARGPGCLPGPITDLTAPRPREGACDYDVMSYAGNKSGLIAPTSWNTVAANFGRYLTCPYASTNGNTSCHEPALP